MKLQRRSFRSLKAIIIATAVLGLGSSSARAAEGHGGGGGHAAAGGGRGGAYGGRGYGGYGGYGRGYGYGGYGWGDWGWGLGLGLGVGLGYDLGYGYGYPYYGYPYPGYAYPGYAYPPPNGSPPVSTPVPGSVPQQVGLPGADATLRVRTPADAIVWINGQKTTQSGSNREFVSSGLAQGRTYTFEVRAQWKGLDGRPVDIEQRIPIQAGERRNVDFGIPSSQFQDLAPVAAEAKH